MQYRPPTTKNSNQSELLISHFNISQAKKLIVLHFDFAGIKWLQIKGSPDVRGNSHPAKMFLVVGITEIQSMSMIWNVLYFDFDDDDNDHYKV